MKTWLLGGELIPRWNITRHDLVEIVIAGDVVAYDPKDHSPIDVDIEARLKEEVRFSTEKLGTFGAGLHYSVNGLDSRREDLRNGLAESLTASADSLLFRMEQILNYEIEHNLEINMPSPPPEAPKHFFFQEGDVWKVGFDGEETTIRDLDGMKYIAYLLQRQGKEVNVQDLYRTAHPVAGDLISDQMPAQVSQNELHAQGSRRRGKRVTKKQEKAWMDKYEDLQARLEEADISKREDLEKEMDALVSRMGSLRQADMDTTYHVQFQKNVRRGIDRAFAAIEEKGMSLLTHHLYENIKPSGEYSYKYIGEITDWKFSK